MEFRGTRVLLAVAIAAVAALVPAASASAGTLDQQQTISNFGGMQVDSAFSKGQTFTAGITGQLDQVDLALSGSGSPNSPLTAEIRDGSATGPGTTVLATASVPTSAVGGSESWVPITFTSPAAVTAGTQYAIVAHSASAGSWFWYAGQGATPDSAYLGGRFFFSSVGPPAMGPWGSGSPADLEFKTYVVPPPPPPPGGGDPDPAPAAKKCKKGQKLKKVKGKKKCVKKKRKKKK